MSETTLLSPAQLAAEAREHAGAVEVLAPRTAELLRTLATAVERGNGLPAGPPLTRQQARIVRFLAQYLREHGYAPTMAEIGAAMGYSSLATVHEHLGNLEEKGYICRSHNQQRAIKLLMEVSR